MMREMQRWLPLTVWVWTLALLCAQNASAGRNEPSGDIRAASSSGGSSGNANVTYPLTAPADSAAAPDYAWSASPSTGLFSPGANLCAAAAGGAEVMRWGSGGAQLASGKQLLCSAGTAAAPCLTFAGTPDRGFFADTTNTGLGISIAGAQTGYLSAAGLTLSSGRLTVPGGSAAAPTQTFVGATTTGNYYDSSNSALAVSVSGAETAYFGASGLYLLSGKLSAPSGTATSPSLGFSNASGVGTYYDATNAALGLAAGAAEVAYVASGGLRVIAGNVQSPNGTTAAPGHSFVGSPNTGIFVDAAVNALAASVNGAEAAYVSQNGELALPLTNMVFPNNVSGVRLGNLDSTGVKMFRNGSGRVQFGLADGSANATAVTRLWQTTNYDGTTQFGSAVSADNSGMKIFYDGSTIPANMYAAVVQQRVLTKQKTAAYTLVKADTGYRVTNKGAASQVVLTLPAATATGTLTSSAEVPFFVVTNLTATGLQIKAAGTDVIQFPGSASSAGGTQTTTTVGGSAKVYVCDTGTWCTEGAVGGTWTGA